MLLILGPSPFTPPLPALPEVAEGALLGGSGGVFGAVGIHDPQRNRLIAFAGQDSFGYVGALQQLALGASGTWLPLTAMGTPPPPDDDYQALYDPVGDRMIVFGSGTK